MQSLETASGVIKRSTRIFITAKDVEVLMGCKKSKASQIVQKVNKLAKEKGKEPFPSGKANKFLFSDVFSIPMEDVDRVLNKEKEV